MTGAASPPEDPAALTRHIESRFHARHRAQLPALAELAEKVERVHFGDEDLPEGLAELLRRMIGELEVHMKKEELMLFPAIRSGRGDPAGLTARMRADHDDHTAEIGRILDLTAGLTPPAGACRSWRELYSGLDAFIADLREHVRLENEVLFPRVESGR